MLEKRYGVIYCDPPWFYNNRKTGGERKDKTKFGGGARKHYPLMKDEELLAMKPFIDDLANENCALFMWATMPRLDFAIELLKKWRFRYATVAFVWIKTKKDLPGIIRVLVDLARCVIYGPGYYTASNVEIVLLGIRGKCPPRRKMLPSIVFAPRGRHSEKPEEVRRRIEQMYFSPDVLEPQGVELFARKESPGWDVWGNEVPNVENIWDKADARELREKQVRFRDSAWR